MQKWLNSYILLTFGAPGYNLAFLLWSRALHLLRFQGPFTDYVALPFVRFNSCSLLRQLFASQQCPFSWIRSYRKLQR
jgi:hypothetical protein